MSTTAKFLKTRAAGSAAIKPGQWHAGFTKVKKYAETNKIPLIAVWSNGDACGHCIMFEEVLMKKIFKNWMTTSGCVFWFGCSSDKTADDKFEGTGFKFARNSKTTRYPFIRVYWKAGKVDSYSDGGSWSGDSNKNANATKLVKKLQTLLKNFKPQTEPTPTPAPTPEPEPTPEVEPATVRLNESLTVAQINAVLDALEKNGMYCPCQIKSEDTKCHCKDFRENKKIGEPCICKIFVKQKLTLAAPKKKAKKGKTC